MRLATLLASADLIAPGAAVLPEAGDAAGVEVAAITADSEAVMAGTLFFCVAGRRHDGHDFAAAAVAAGAVTLVCQRPLDVPVPQVVVADVRAAMGPLAAAFYGNPSAALSVVGVTGTNGKTTTTHLLESIFRAAGRPAASVGTLSGTRTTPEAPILQATLARLRDEGVAAVAMEVSSHALVQRRIDGVRFAAAVFTNLSQDHLDYHGSMEDYFDAKRVLFQPGRAAVAVVNDGDPWGRRLLDELRTRGLEEGAATPIPFSRLDAEDLEIGPQGSRFRWRGVPISLRLGGRFNVDNALAAATTALALGVEEPAIAAGLETVESVRGRFEAVRVGQPFAVLVDYAHTPDGLEQALGAARELVTGNGRLTAVFGAGGDRDPGKRPLMGEVASRLADWVVLTSDNPRTEDPDAILADVAAGTNGHAQVEVEPDRRQAILVALAAAEDGDVVLIAGKGHETVQEVGGKTLPFDDVEVARAALRDRGWGR